jgi:hypothetical protein
VIRYNVLILLGVVAMVANKQTKFRVSMCVEIINMFSAGKSRAQFCARHKISKRTFDNYLDRYPMFADAYDAAQEQAKAYFDAMAIDNMIEEPQGPKLNTRLYELTLRNRFEMPGTRIVKLEGLAARSAQDKIDAICLGVQEGKLTPDEAQKLSSLINVSISAQQFDEMLGRIEKIEQCDKIGLDDDGFEEVKE